MSGNDFYQYQTEEQVRREEKEAAIANLSRSHTLAVEAGDRDMESSFLGSLIEAAREKRYPNHSAREDRAREMYDESDDPDYEGFIFDEY